MAPSERWKPEARTTHSAPVPARGAPRHLRARTTPRCSLEQGQRVRLLLCALATLLACTSPRPPLPQGPQVRAPPELTVDELLPPDATFIVRIDRQRLGSMFHLEPLDEALADRLRAVPSFLRLWSSAQTAWIALHELPLSGPVDGTLLLEGHWQRLELPSLASVSGWHELPLATDDMHLYLHDEPLVREEPAAVALLHERILLVSTSLDAPFVRQALTEGRPALSQSLPRDGLLDARLDFTHRQGPLYARYPSLAHLLQGSTVTASVDVEALGEERLRLDAFAECASEKSARKLEALTQSLDDELQATSMAHDTSTEPALLHERTGLVHYRVTWSHDSATGMLDALHRWISPPPPTLKQPAPASSKAAPLGPQELPPVSKQPAPILQEPPSRPRGP